MGWWWAVETGLLTSTRMKLQSSAAESSREPPPDPLSLTFYARPPLQVTEHQVGGTVVDQQHPLHR